MEKNDESQGKTLSVPLSLIFTLVGLAILAVSLYLPWWERLDNTVGPLFTIYLYKLDIRSPFNVEDYVWAVRVPILKTAMLYPFIFMVASILLSIVSVLLRKSKSIMRGITVMMSGVASTVSFFIFQSLFERYIKIMGETVSGTIGYLHWGYGLGNKLSIAAAALMIAAGALQLLRKEHFELELVFEKESEDE